MHYCHNNILMSHKSHPLFVSTEEFCPTGQSKRMHSLFKANVSSNFTSKIRHPNLDISGIVGSPIAAMDIHTGEVLESQSASSFTSSTVEKHINAILTLILMLFVCIHSIQILTNNLNNKLLFYFSQ